MPGQENQWLDGTTDFLHGMFDITFVCMTCRRETKVRMNPHDDYMLTPKLLEEQGWDCIWDDTESDWMMTCPLCTRQELHDTIEQLHRRIATLTTACNAALEDGKNYPLSEHVKRQIRAAIARPQGVR